MAVQEEAVRAVVGDGRIGDGLREVVVPVINEIVVWEENGEWRWVKVSGKLMEKDDG